MATAAYKLDVLIQGFPGRSVCHGGLGWSTIAMLRGNDRVVLVDVGERKAGVYAWFDEDLHRTTMFDFAPRGWQRER